jgi:DNA-directed RNA polymerase subunit F
MDKDYCSIFELYAILKDKNTKLTKVSNPQIDQIFNKTLQYVERFNKFGFTESSDRAASKAVELRK